MKSPYSWPSPLTRWRHRRGRATEAVFDGHYSGYIEGEQGTIGETGRYVPAGGHDTDGDGLVYLPLGKPVICTAVNVLKRWIPVDRAEAGGDSESAGPLRALALAGLSLLGLTVLLALTALLAVALPLCRLARVRR